MRHSLVTLSFIHVTILEVIQFVPVSFHNYPGFSAVFESPNGQLRYLDTSTPTPSLLSNFDDSFSAIFSWTEIDSDSPTSHNFGSEIISVDKNNINIRIYTWDDTVIKKLSGIIIVYPKKGKAASSKKFQLPKLIIISVKHS